MLTNILFKIKYKTNIFFGSRLNDLIINTHLNNKGNN